MASFSPSFGGRSNFLFNTGKNLLGMLDGSNQRENQQAQLDAAKMAMEFEQSSADKAMQFSADQADIERKWYEQMSSSAHQREVADLKAAGLNPILSANGGAASAATGVATGFSAQGQKADVDTYNQTLGLLGAVSGLFSSAATLNRTRAPKSFKVGF